MKAQTVGETPWPVSFLLAPSEGESLPEAGTLKEVPQSFITKLKSGDADAFADVYQMYRRSVFGVILRIVESPAIAEDLAQESFLKLWRNASRLKLEYQYVGPWLMRIARNCALDHRKSVNALRMEQIVTDHAAPNGQSEDAAAWNSRRLNGAFQQLPPEQKEVIVLSFYHGLSQMEIAERLQQPLGTIKGRVRLGLAKLRAAMEENSVPPERPLRYH